MTRISGGEAATQALKALDVEVVFAIASIHNLAILEAIRSEPSIRVVMSRHEQGAVHAADGYSRASGRLGVAIVSTGPGTANTAGGLFEARFSSSSVLLITGQIESQFYGQGRGFIHEAEQQMDMLESLTKRSWSVARAEDISGDLIAAGQLAVSGRRGPTAIEIPVDFQYALIEPQEIQLRPMNRQSPNSESIAAAVSLLGAAKRPVIWTGGGVIASGASGALIDFVERTRIPVLTSTQGRGAIPENHELWLSSTTSPEIAEILADADVVVAIGTRFQYYPSALWTVRPGEKLIHIDVDPSVIGRNYQADVSVISDAKLAIEALDVQLPEMHIDASWVPRVTAKAKLAKDSALDIIGSDHRKIVEIIRQYLPDGGAVVRDSTMPAYYWGDSLLEIRQPRTSMNPSSASIGPGLPLAIGAALGRRETSVVIHGDGGIMLSLGELIVIAESDVPLIVLIFNDRAYGVLKGIQGATFDSENEFVDLHTPNFVTLAESMGLKAELVQSAAEFEVAFKAAVDRGGMCVIEVDMLALEPFKNRFQAQDFVSKRFLEADEQ